jgi:hypothetical protein
MPINSKQINLEMKLDKRVALDMQTHTQGKVVLKRAARSFAVSQVRD